MLSVIWLGCWSVASVADADEALRGRTIGVTCAGCHGTDGVGSDMIPTLKGKDAASLEALLTEYKAGERTGSVMPRIAKGYSAADIKAVAAYFASLQD
ncbi:MAG: c-type cytochrome [Thiothrix sp.]|nr:c-type cytochrome [Thiothrix sp.]HPE58768.1 c-type cytochrome [Thiolinea sp.]